MHPKTTLSVIGVAMKTFRYHIFAFALALATAGINVRSATVPETGEAIHSVMRMEGDFHGSLFEESVVEFTSDRKLPKRRLQIICVKGCASEIKFHEDFYDSPVSMFRLWDGSDKLITIWASGSAHWVRIYCVKDDGIHKIFEQATRSAPQFGIDAHGAPIVILDNPDAEAAPIDFVIHGSVWRWNSKQYIPKD
jgi:hypothetical protein